MKNTNPASDAPVSGVAKTDKAGGAAPEEKMRQPHERDESPDNGKTGTDRQTDSPQKEVKQAHEDVERGLVDTDRRGVPSNVPRQRTNKAP